LLIILGAKSVSTCSHTQIYIILTTAKPVGRGDLFHFERARLGFFANQPSLKEPHRVGMPVEDELDVAAGNRSTAVAGLGC
jgi:hypothetical protein